MKTKYVCILSILIVLTSGIAMAIPENKISEKEDKTLNQKIATSMFIGDVGDNTVKQFDANTGKFLGTFVASGINGLNDPMGLLFSGRNLLVVNQNFGLPPGEIFRFDRNTGTFLNKLVASDNPYAPFAPSSEFQRIRLYKYFLFFSKDQVGN